MIRHPKLNLIKMKRSILTLVYCLWALTIFAQAGSELRITHGPWIQNVSATGATVMWTTNIPSVPGILLSADGVKYDMIQNSVDGMIHAGDTLHKVRIRGLNPGETYLYKVYSRGISVFEPYKITYSDTLISAPVTFRTANPEAAEVSFVVLNDVHGRTDKMAGYINNSAVEDPDFYVFNGDMVDYFQAKDQIFKGFLDTAVFYFAKATPFIYVRGNHEARGMYARYFKDFFDFDQDRFYGSFRRGPVQFLVLDCGEDKPDDNQYYFQLAAYDNYRFTQLEWLKKEISSEGFKAAPFRIVLIHMPVIAGSDSGYGMEFLSKHFGPVLKDAGIDLMLSGHTHRSASLNSDESGFGYPVMISSNNSFTEVEVNENLLRAIVRDIKGAKVIGLEISRK